MGYDTIINRQFIKVDEKRFIPYVNSRTSNCTTINDNGREVKVQEHYPLNMGKQRNVTTIEELELYFENLVQEKIEFYKDNENYSEEERNETYIRENLGWLLVFFVGSNRYMSQKQMLTWFKSGFKQAKTIEEMIEKFSASFTFRNYDTKDNVEIHSTDELKAFLEREDANQYQFMINMFSWVYERIKRDNRTKKASTQRVKKPVEQDHFFVVNSTIGYLVKRKRSLYSAWTVNGAQRFKTEKLAEKFVEAVNKRYTLNGVTIEKINEKATF